MPQGTSGDLLHLSLLPAKIIGYVSTQSGVAIEYIKHDITSILTIKGSKRVEEILTSFSLKKCRCVGMYLDNSKATLSNSGFSNMFPFLVNGRNSSLVVSDSIFSYFGYTKSIQYSEIYGDRDYSHWTVEKAESRAKDEVMAALAQIARANQTNMTIEKYISTYKDRTILLLGDYSEDGMSRLTKIFDYLKLHGYEVMLLKDIPDHPHHDLRQKVTAVASIARFIVIDDSSKSGHLIEVDICRQNFWITILARKYGHSGSYMTAGSSCASNVIKEIDYDLENINEAFSRAIEWAESKLIDVSRDFTRTYPWRKRES